MSCLTEKNPHIQKQLTQICFFAQQSAHKIVSNYSRNEVEKRAKLRNISTQQPLELQKSQLQDQITREIYILEISNLTLWPTSKIYSLSRKLKIKPQDFPDTVHLAWIIALTIIRDKIPYKFNRKRDILLLAKGRINGRNSKKK